MGARTCLLVAAGRRRFAPPSVTPRVMADVAAARVVRSSPVARGLHIIGTIPGSDRYLVTAEGDARLVVLGANGRMEGTIPLFAQPRVPAVMPAGDRTYQTIRWLNSALVVDLAKGATVDRIVLGESRFAEVGTEAPIGLPRIGR